MNESTGRITQIQGSVVDVEFSSGDTPFIYEALKLKGAEDTEIVLEVQKLLNNNVARLCIDEFHGWCAARD